MRNPKITRKKLADYKPADFNPNQHTERGLQVIEDSIHFNGAGRSGLVAKDGAFIAGHGTWEAMARAGIEDVIEIEADGHQWVIVRRNDLDSSDPRAKALMVADNRASELDYAPDGDMLAALLTDIVAQDENLLRGTGFSEGELQALLGSLHDAKHNGDSINIPEQYMILIECHSEIEQAELLMRFDSEGLKCRALIS